MEEKYIFIHNNYKDLQDLISLYDQKANINLFVQGLLISACFTTIFIINVISRLKIFSAFLAGYLILFFLFLITAAIGLYFSLNIYRSRGQSPKNKGLIFYKKILKMTDGSEYAKRVMEINQKELLKEYSEEIYALSIILSHKEKNLKKSQTMLKINIVSFIAFMLMNIFIQIV